MMKNIFLFLLCLFSLIRTSTAQDGKAPSARSGAEHAAKRTIVATFGTNPDALLKKAGDLFNAGDYDACISLLDSLDKNQGFNKMDREDLLTLLVKAELEEDNLDKANAAARKLLLNNPHYELVDANNEDNFNKLIRSFDIHPLLSFGIRNTMLFASMPTTKVNSLPSYSHYDAPYNPPKYFLMYYGWVEYHFGKDFSVNAEALFWNLTYNRSLALSPARSLNYSETMHFLEIPVYVKQYVPHVWNISFLKNILPYGALGFSWLRMTGANAIAWGNMYNANGTAVLGSYSSGTTDVLSARKLNMFEWVVGGGIGYKLKNLRLFLEWRYYGGLNSFTNSSGQGSINPLTPNYSYTDNAVKINKTELGASISFTLRNSVKKKKK
jgi:hypothetical protein